MCNLEGFCNGASLRRPGCTPGLVHVGYALDEVARFSSSQAFICLRAFISGVHKTSGAWPFGGLNFIPLRLIQRVSKRMTRFQIIISNNEEVLPVPVAARSKA